MLRFSLILPSIEFFYMSTYPTYHPPKFISFLFYQVNFLVSTSSIICIILADIRLHLEKVG